MRALLAQEIRAALFQSSSSVQQARPPAARGPQWSCAGCGWHCRHCGLLVCAACFSADVESASGEGWLRICVVCAVALADEAVEQPDAQVEEIATVVHEMIQRTERRRDAERAREEGSLMNAVKRNVQVVIDQRREKHNEWWQEWHNGGQNAAMLKQTTKPCVKCEVPIVSLDPWQPLHLARGLLTHTVRRCRKRMAAAFT